MTPAVGSNENMNMVGDLDRIVVGSAVAIGIGCPVRLSSGSMVGDVDGRRT